MKVQRRVKPATASGAWQRDGAAEVDRAIAAGLGIRPEEWWLFDSGRPELGNLDPDDVYVDLRGPGAHQDAACARLRYLDRSGQLTPSERSAINAGTGPRYEWRQIVLSERRRS
jgi:hypothetical protein